MSVWVGVQVPIEQRLDWGGWGDGLGETISSVLAVLQGPVPHRGKRGVRRIGGRVWMKRVSPAVDRGVGLPDVLSTAHSLLRFGLLSFFSSSCFVRHDNNHMFIS